MIWVGLMLALAACARPGEPRKGEGAGEMRFLALGDSYTIGEGVDAAERWPVQLAALLRERGIEVADPQIIARTGWTTDELSAAIDAADPRGPYALVTLLIGVNNQYRGRSADEYRAASAALLQRAIGFAGGDASRVVVLSIPDWSVTPFAEDRDRAQIAAEIDAYNAINRDEARRAVAHWVDVAPQSRAAGGDPAFLAADGLHPSGRAYAEWARLALPAAVEALGPSPAAPSPARREP
jgi:lysophospholipase L1-like esterase